MAEQQPPVRRGPGRPPLNRNKLNPSASTPSQWGQANNRGSPSSSSYRPSRAASRASAIAALPADGSYIPPHLHPAYRGRGRPPLSLGRRVPPPVTQQSTKPQHFVARQNQQQQQGQGHHGHGQQQQGAAAAHHRNGPASGPGAQQIPPGGQVHGAQQQGAPHPSGSSLLASKEPLYVAPGPTNRILLSLKSGLPSHIRWALVRLVQLSMHNVDALVLDAFPGMIEALVRFPKQLVLALREGDPKEWEPRYIEQEERAFDGMGATFQQDVPSDDEDDESEAETHNVNVKQEPDASHIFNPHDNESHKRLLDNAVMATLVLRNVSLFERNERTIFHHSRTLNALVADLLTVPITLKAEAGVKEWNGLVGLHELRTYALDILESTRLKLHIRTRLSLTFNSAGVPVLPPVVPSATAADEVTSLSTNLAHANAKSVANARVSDQIFGQLVWLLHTTNDRSVLLGCLRCLGAMAAEEKNEQVFIEVEVPAGDGQKTTSPGIIRKCLSLLPITHDAILLEAALDCLYQTITIGDNVLRLGNELESRSPTTSGLVSNGEKSQASQGEQLNLPLLDIRSVVRFLLRDLVYGRVIWERTHQLSLHPALHQHVPSAVLGRARERDDVWRKKRKLAERSEKELARQKKLSKEEWLLIKDIPEPERLKVWMRTIYEAKEDGEVTQMEFWTTYSSQFGPYSQLGGPILLQAAEVIRSVSSIFPGALAMVMPDKRYLVRGVRPRDRSRPFECQWAQCSNPETETLPSVTAHVEEHVRDTTDNSCHWAFCTYSVPKDVEDAKVHLQAHVLTHLPQSQEHGDLREKAQERQQRLSDLKWKATLKSQALTKADMPNGARYISGPTALMPFSMIENEWRLIEAERQEGKRRKAMNLPTRGTVDLPDILTFCVTRTPMDALTSRATGIASTAALILRSLARSSATHLLRQGERRQRYRGESDGEVKGEEVWSESSERFGFPLPPAQGDKAVVSLAEPANGASGPGSGGESGKVLLPSLDEDRATKAAERIMDSLIDIEDDLVQVASENDILCPIINEILFDLQPELGQPMSELDHVTVGAGEDTSLSLLDEDEEEDEDEDEDDDEDDDDEMDAEGEEEEMGQ